MVATVVAAGVSLTVLVVVMVAMHVGIVAELTSEVGNNCRISTALYAAEELYACLGKSILCAAADTAADEYVNAVFF